MAEHHLVTAAVVEFDGLVRVRLDQCTLCGLTRLRMSDGDRYFYMGVHLIEEAAVEWCEPGRVLSFIPGEKLGVEDPRSPV